MLVTHALQTEKKVLYNAILYENHSNFPSRRSVKRVSVKDQTLMQLRKTCLRLVATFPCVNTVRQCATGTSNT